MTKAEEMEMNLSEDEDFDTFEEATIHRTKDDEPVLEYDDGSILSLAESIKNMEEGGTFASMAEFMEQISVEEEVDAEIVFEESESRTDIIHSSQSLYMALEGTVEESDFKLYIEMPFVLTGITRNGEPYRHFGSTDWNETERVDFCPITYTVELAANVGNRVRVKCALDHFHEERRSTRGIPYFVDTDFLHAPTLLSVLASVEEANV